MNSAQARALRVGDIVEIDVGGRMVRGEVIHINPGAAINVHWDDGERSATHPSDCDSWRKVHVKAAKR